MASCIGYARLMSQAYRDLKWALTSPQMLHLCTKHIQQPKDQPPCLDWLAEQEQNIQNLEQALSKNPTHRLGLYYEHLIQYFFESHPDFELLLYNHQIYENKQTLGAFDFVYQNKEKQIVHRECAVKFFLGVPHLGDTDQSPWSNWWGPNKVDRLDKKINLILEKQIQLSHLPQAQDFLSEKNINIDVKEVDIKGCLFYPYQKSMPAPKGASKVHLRSEWLTVDDFKSMETNSYWETLPKMRWLSPAVSHHQILDTPHFKSNIQQYFANHDQPILVAEYASHAIGQTETRRLFITQNTWIEQEGHHGSI